MLVLVKQIRNGREFREFGPWMVAGINARTQTVRSISYPFHPNRIALRKMKVAIVFLAVVACALAQRYTTKYDNIDLDQILRSKRLLDNYVKCLLGEGNCTPDGNELKKSLPDALERGCRECTQKQREGSEKVIRYLVNKRPDVWDKLAKKFDPHNQYRVKFEGEAQKAGIAL